MKKKPSFFRPHDIYDEELTSESLNENMQDSINRLFPDGVEDAFDQEEDLNLDPEEEEGEELEISDTELALICRARICPSCPVMKEAEDIRLRSLAEMDNYKKRMDREKEDHVRYSNEKILKDIIPALDNLDLALQHAPASDESKNFVLGVEMTKKLLMDTLEKHGLQETGTIGEAFDPNLHEAMALNDTPEVPDGHICGLMAKGYSLNGRLLRPAQVMVCKKA